MDETVLGGEEHRPNEAIGRVDGRHLPRGGGDPVPPRYVCLGDGSALREAEHGDEARSGRGSDGVGVFEVIGGGDSSHCDVSNCVFG